MKVLTLLERAKPELLERLEEYGISYPSSAARVMHDLERLHFVNDLPYGSVIDIEGLYKVRVHVFDLFNRIELS
jgi:hypothetical protein